MNSSENVEVYEKRILASLGLTELKDRVSYITESKHESNIYYVKWAKNRVSHHMPSLQVAAGNYQTRFMACIARECVKLMYREWLERENVKSMSMELGEKFKREAEDTTANIVADIFAADLDDAN